MSFVFFFIYIYDLYKYDNIVYSYVFGFGSEVIIATLFKEGVSIKSRQLS